MAHILVVDDESAVRETIAAVLETEGHEVQQARDGQDALEVVLERMPELILLDLAMPRMDGWRFLEELHERELRRKTRVIIVSGRYDPSSATATQRSRVGTFLRKPFEPDSLLRMVEDALLEEPADLYEKRERSDNLVRLIERVDRALS
jgi:two-component system nitrogen regulation response regulator NtrX